MRDLGGAAVELCALGTINVCDWDLLTTLNGMPNIDGFFSIIHYTR